MIKRFKVLASVIVISFVLHSFCFFGIEFDFSGSSFKYSPEVFFWGQLLNEADFLALGLKSNFSGQGKSDDILYKRSKFSKLDAGLDLSGEDRKGAEKISPLNFKKPHLIYSASMSKSVSDFSQADKSQGEDLPQALRVAKQKLTNPFFYKELPAPVVEAELKTLADGRVLLIRRVKSSGDLEVDLFVLRVIRRRLYLEGKKPDVPLKRIRVLLNND